MSVRPATWRDLDGVSALCSVRGRLSPFAGPTGLARLRAAWDAPGFAVGRDNWVVEEGSVVVGYAALDLSQRLVHIASDQATGEALLDRISLRARERGFPNLTVSIPRDDDALRSTLFAGGLRLERKILSMWKALAGDDPRPVWPAGVYVRSYRAGDDDAEVHRLLDDAYRSWDAAYRPVAHAEWVASMTGDSEFDEAVWWLAERDGELAGCALHWSTGWLKDLAVRERERRQGLAMALLRHGFAELRRRGVTRVGLKVDAANPTGAIGLYLRVGFKIEQTEEVWALCP